MSVSRYAIQPRVERFTTLALIVLQCRFTVVGGGNRSLLSGGIARRTQIPNLRSVLLTAVYFFFLFVVCLFCLCWNFWKIHTTPVDKRLTKNNECIQHISGICPLLANTSNLISHPYLNRCTLSAPCSSAEIKICTEPLHSLRNWISYLFYDYFFFLFFFKKKINKCKLFSLYDDITTDLLYLLLLISGSLYGSSFSMK